jgi:hypothetical protein
LLGAAIDEGNALRRRARIEFEHTFVELSCRYIEHFDEDGAAAVNDHQRVGTREQTDALKGRVVFVRVEAESAANRTKPFEAVFLRRRLTPHGGAQGRIGRDRHARKDGLLLDERRGVAKGLVGITGDDDGDLGGRQGSVSVSVSARAGVCVGASVRIGEGRRGDD